MQTLKLADTYNSLYKLIITEDKTEIEDVTRLIDHISTANRVLLEFGLYLQKDGDYVNYLPGSFDNSGNFYNHHITIGDKLLLVSFRERDFFGKSSLGISKEEQAGRSNPKGFEISLRTIVDYEVTSFKLHTNNDFGIFNAVRTLHYLKLYFKEGFALHELNPNFGTTYTVRLMQRHTENCYKRIFDFANSLRFIEWGEVISRVGKDNRIESGVIIVNDIKNNYFSYLINKFTDFKQTEHNRFSGKSGTDYGYIKSSPYHEHEMSEFDAEKYRNEILSALIENYNPDKDIIFQFYKL
jgi:hypothetical protein